MKMISWLVLAASALSISCASKPYGVDVSVFHLKDIELASTDNRSVRAEQQKRLRGAVEEADRLARRGLYYTINWDFSATPEVEPTRVLFRYHQAASGAKELQAQQPVHGSVGVCEFSLIGKDYQKNGRVLNWRVEVYAGDQLVGYEQSYLWR